MTGKVGITCGAFDLLHAGHIIMLEEAKTVCDHLIVALQTDPSIDRPDDKNAPCQTIVERQIQLKAVKFVDEIIVYETEQDLYQIFKTLPLDIRIIGEEYKEIHFTGREICKKRNIEIGKRNFGKVSVLSGINEGDLVISEGISKVRNKAKVKIINP